MPWYLEYDFQPFGIGAVQRSVTELDCPDDIGAREKAVKKAHETIASLKLKNPQLVWKEKVFKTKRRPA